MGGVMKSAARALSNWVALAGLLAVVALPAAVAQAAQSDPAAAQIEAFDDAVLGVMKDAKALGIQGRYHRLEPAVTRAFDTATMVRFAVGPSWASATPAQQEALKAAFLHLTIAGYAHNFSGYSGERFDIDPRVLSRGADKVVTTHIAAPGQAPVSIAYVLRDAGAGWKIVDVLYNGGISQLATRRADFAATVQSGGPGALVTRINALVDKQMK
jgi:phospholipid transport system substrate-binding protein